MPTSPERARDLRLQRQYGITAEDYDKILAFQGGGCAICGAPPGKNRLAVDHDHTTGLTRGLLCWRHNAGLQKFGDDADLMENGAYYLRQPPATHALGHESFGRTGRVTNRRPKRRKRRVRTTTKRS